MTFMLLEHSPRPLKLRGNKITAATVIPLSKERMPLAITSEPRAA